MKITYLQHIIKGLRYRKYYVVLDGRSNSVTISKAVYDHIMGRERNKDDVFIFKTKEAGHYCFAMREDLTSFSNQVPCVPLQYNEQYRKIGFRTDSPSVTGILASYGLPIDRMVRLSCFPCKTTVGEVYYEIQPSLQR